MFISGIKIAASEAGRRVKVAVWDGRLCAYPQGRLGDRLDLILDNSVDVKGGMDRLLATYRRLTIASKRGGCIRGIYPISHILRCSKVLGRVESEWDSHC